MDVRGHRAGLYALSPPADAPPGYDDGMTALGLRGVDVHAEVRDLCARVTISQRYVNQLRTTADCGYRFPLDSRAAVCGFEVEADGVLTRGEVQAKVEARQTYTAAISRGDGAQLLEQDRGDVFRMAVGNVRPGQTVTVKISYVTDLKIDGDAVVFYLPTHVAPRYCAASDPSPLPADHAAPQSVGDGLHLTVRIDMGSAITSVTSETHAAGLAVGPAPPRTSNVTAAAAAGDEGRSRLVTLRQGTPVLDADIVIKIATLHPHQPRCIVETLPNGSRAAVLTLAPKIELDCERAEIVFVVDCSGSMSGSNILQASRAMQLFLRSLPVDCFVNIVRFGSRHTSLWPSPRKYDARSMADAARYIEGMQADLGGTAMQAPLAHVLGQPAVPGYSRQVFVLTDGAVSNTTGCIDTVSRGVAAYVHEHRRPCRVFGLGLGHGASRELVEGIARVGGGTADFVLGTELDEKVIAQLKTALQPALNAVVVEWKGCNPVSAASDSPPLTAAAAAAAASPDTTPTVPPPSPTVIGSLLGYVAHRPGPVSTVLPAPFTAPPVFSGSRYLTFCVVEPGTTTPTAVHVTAETPAGKLDVLVPVEHAVSSHSHGVIHPMAARALIRDLEDCSSWLHAEARPTDVTADKVKAEITRLAISHSLVSSHTSFVAVQVDVTGGKPAIARSSAAEIWQSAANNESSNDDSLQAAKKKTKKKKKKPASPSSASERSSAHTGRESWSVTPQMQQQQQQQRQVLPERQSQRYRCIVGGASAVPNRQYRQKKKEKKSRLLDNDATHSRASDRITNAVRVGKESEAIGAGVLLQLGSQSLAKSARPARQILIGDLFGSLNPFGGPKIDPGLNSTKVIMSNNISGLLSRGEALDDLADRSEDLAMNSAQFFKASKKTGGGWSGWNPFSAAKSQSADLTRSLPSTNPGMQDANTSDSALQAVIGHLAAQASAIECELDEQNAVLDDMMPSGPNVAAMPGASKMSKMSKTTGDTLLALTRLQEFSGAFPLTADLCTVVGADLATAKAAARQLAAGDAAVSAADAMTIIATLLALAHFAETLSGKRAVWELLAKKAHAWLKASCCGLQLGDAVASNMARHGLAAPYAQLVAALG